MFYRWRCVQDLLFYSLPFPALYSPSPSIAYYANSRRVLLSLLGVLSVCIRNFILETLEGPNTNIELIYELLPIENERR
jgi:hypothetical protein